MPFVVTPQQLSQRAEFYHQLSQLTEVGIVLPQALERLRRHPPARSFREPISRLLRQLNEGATFSEALHSTGRWLPFFDRALLEAGEMSGRLSSCFRILADYYQERAVLLRKVLSDLGYPLFLLHFAVFIGPFPELFKSGDLVAYLFQTFGVLLPIYAIVVLFIYALQGRHGESWRALVEGIVRCIPIAGGARVDLALARLSAALEALVMAGVSIIEAWELAAAASGSPALLRTVRAWRPQLLAGQTPAEAVSQSGKFPDLFANLYSTGEVTGKLDATLNDLRRIYQEDATRKIRALADWTPKLIYFGIVLMIAYRVLSFWSGYYGQVNDLNQF